MGIGSARGSQSATRSWVREEKTRPAGQGYDHERDVDWQGRSLCLLPRRVNEGKKLLLLCPDGLPWEKWRFAMVGYCGVLSLEMDGGWSGRTPLVMRSMICSLHFDDALFCTLSSTVVLVKGMWSSLLPTCVIGRRRGSCTD